MKDLGIKNAAIMHEGIDMARKFGHEIMEEASGSGSAIMCAAIMLSTFAESSGATEEQMLDVLKSVHRLTKEFAEKSCMQ